jgi:hypothetical protein
MIVLEVENALMEDAFVILILLGKIVEKKFANKIAAVNYFFFHKVKIC